MKLSHDFNTRSIRIEITQDEFMAKGGRAIQEKTIDIVSEELSKMVLESIKGNIFIWKRRSKKIAIVLALLFAVVKFFFLLK